MEVWALARLYEAGLDRDGNLDRSGLNFWIDQLDAGSSFDFISSRFLLSEEFTSTAGRPVSQLTNRDFVEILYSNVLDREGEAGGVDFWLNELDSGLRSRSDVLYQFAISPENVAGSRYVEELEFANGDWWFPEITDFLPSDASTAVDIPIGGFAVSQIDFAGDRDWIGFDVVAGQQYTVSLAGDGPEGQSLGDPYLRIYDGFAAFVAENDDNDGTLDSRTSFTATFTERYYAEAAAFGNGTGTYVVEVTAGGSTTEENAEIGEGIDTSSRIAPGETVFSRIDFLGDKDWHKIFVTPETRYEIGLSGDDGSANSLRDPFLSFFDSDGALLATNDDGAGELNSFLSIVPSESGAYYIEASEFGNNDTGFYALTVASSAADIPGGTATTSTMLVNGMAEGTIGFEGDIDWFAIELEGGRDYDVFLDGSDLGGNRLSDPVVAIYNGLGGLLASNDDGGISLNSYLRFSPDTDGTYYAAADGLGSATGDYALSVIDAII